MEALLWLGILESDVQHSVVVHIPFNSFVKHIQRDIRSVRKDWAARPKLDEIPPPPPDDPPSTPVKPVSTSLESVQKLIEEDDNDPTFVRH